MRLSRFGKWFASSRRWGYAVAVVFTSLFVALLLGVNADRPLPITTLLVLPVMVSAYFGGFGPGLLAMACAITLAHYTGLGTAYVGPAGTFLNDLAQRWSSFLLVTIFMSVLIETLHRARRTMQTNEVLRSVTLASIGEAVVTTDKQGHITFLNAVAERLSGWDTQSAVGQAFTRAFPIIAADTQAPIADLPAETLRSGNTIRLPHDSYLRTRSGASIPVETSAAPIRLADGSVHGVVLTLRDVSERRRVEGAMYERIALQERLAAIAQMLPGALHTLKIRQDGSAVLTYASPSFEAVYGLDPAPLATDAAPMRLCVHPEDWPWINERVQQGMRLLQPVRIEYRVQHAVKGMIWVELHAVPTRETDGSTLWHGVIFDITQRKRVEDELRTSQLQLRAALDAGGMGILRIQLESGAVEFDDTAGQLWGITRAQSGKKGVEALLEAIHDEDRARFQQEYRDALEGKLEEGFRTEFRVVHADGSTHWLGFRARIENTATEPVRQATCLISDVTFRRRAEELRLRSQKLEALGVLAGGIAHDFNNLLLAISGNLELMKQDLPEAHPAQQSLREVAKASARATTLVRQILTFSQPQDQQREWIELRPVLEEVVSFARSIMPATIVLDTDLAEAPRIIANTGQIHQAMINLLTNAVDAVPAAGGRVTVRLDRVEVDGDLMTGFAGLRPGRYARISVADNGDGMDQKTQQRIFDPFFTTKPVGHGTGLGLAIVHGIMKASGGAITVDSAPGAGATFSLYFPAAQGELAVAPAAKPALSAKKARVLYVDDEESLVFLVTRTLERAGHRVAGFSDPHKALEAFQQAPQEYDLVVSDVSMPGMTGFNLARALLGIRADVPIVITSGYLRPADYALAKEIGIRELILKPDTIDELGAALDRLLG